MKAPAVRHRVLEGQPFPLGATWDGLGVNFALFSANATKVELCLFDNDGEREIERIELPEYTDEVWHGYLPDARPGQLYGYRVHGPYEPAEGHRFNPNKLLLDPYARQIVGELKWDPALFGYTLGSPEADLSFDERDSAPFMPKCRVIDPAFTWGEERRPQIPWERTIFYEAHVRGFTMRHPAVPRGAARHLRRPDAPPGGRLYPRPRRHRGRAAADPRLRRRQLSGRQGPAQLLGLQHDRLLRAAAALSVRAPTSTSSRRWWRDSTTPASRSSWTWSTTTPPRATNSARRCRSRASTTPPIIGWRRTGATTSTTPAPATPSICRIQRVLQMVTDSLRYWAQEMQVDGFRFDLATILAREPYGFDEGGGFLDACRQDPVLSQVKLIAEPWDCGPGGYQVGHFSPGWAEWNDRFRDTVRAFWKGDEGKLAEFGTRLSASADLFNKRGRKPWASVNFVTAHDGFTLNDLVSYNDKHNEANGEDNRDGHSHNLSWNHGVEGPTDDPEIRELRFRQMRNLLATVLLSHGTPMMLAGDEFGRTQQGNNNAYAQDNEISWLDWQGIGEEGRALIEFTQKLIQTRQRQPLFHRGRFLTGAFNEELGIKDVTWVDPAGAEMTSEQWTDGNARCVGMLLDGRAQVTGIRRKGSDNTLFLMFNAHHDTVRFAFPDVPRCRIWDCLIDTNRPTDSKIPGARKGAHYDMAGRSLSLWEARQA